MDENIPVYDLSVSYFRITSRSVGFIILSVLAPRKTKPEDFLQYILFRSAYKPKPKDFLKLIQLIFFCDYPLKT